MSTLGWLKDEELKPSETQLPAAETQLAVSGLIMSSTVLPAIPNDIAMTPQNHTTKSMICQYQPWDMKCWISFWHHPQQKKHPLQRCLQISAEIMAYPQLSQLQQEVLEAVKACDNETSLRQALQRLQAPPAAMLGGKDESRGWPFFRLKVVASKNS